MSECQTSKYFFCCLRITEVVQLTSKSGHIFQTIWVSLLILENNYPLKTTSFLNFPLFSYFAQSEFKTERIGPHSICVLRHARIINPREFQHKLSVPPWYNGHPLFLILVVQFGFITVFIAAFPLGPLFALLNNLIEIRVDAYKFVTIFRRPMAQRTEDIGIWFEILSGVAKISVVVNVSCFSPVFIFILIKILIAIYLFCSFSLFRLLSLALCRSLCLVFTMKYRNPIIPIWLAF